MENLYRMRQEHLVEISESMKYCSQVESFLHGLSGVTGIGFVLSLVIRKKRLKGERRR